MSVESLGAEAASTSIAATLFSVKTAITLACCVVAALVLGHIFRAGKDKKREVTKDRMTGEGDPASSPAVSTAAPQSTFKAAPLKSAPPSRDSAGTPASVQDTSGSSHPPYKRIAAKADPRLLAAAQGIKLMSAEDSAVEAWHDYSPPRHAATVVSFDCDSGFGFLKPEDPAVTGGEARNIFVHEAAVQVLGPRRRVVLAEKQAVSFVLSEDGRRALDVRDPGGHPLVMPVCPASLDLCSHTVQFRGGKEQQEDRWTGPERLKASGRCMGMGEDGEVEEDELGSQASNYDATFFGIYDGHGGICSSEYLARSLHHKLAELLEQEHRNEEAKKEEAAEDEESEDIVCRALRNTFEAVDEELMQDAAFQVAQDGSTGLVALFTGNEPPVDGAAGNLKIYVANCGDCRAVLCRAGN
jgi:cold shock CspA family protein